MAQDKGYVQISSTTSQIADVDTIDSKFVNPDPDKAEVLVSFFTSQCSTSSGEDIDPGTLYSLLENHLIFHIQPIPEGEVLKLLQHLSVNKSFCGHKTSNSLKRNSSSSYPFAYLRI